MLWREVKDKPYMLVMETGKGIHSAVAYAMVIQIPNPDGKGFKEVFRGGAFRGTSNSPFLYAARKNNINFGSFHEVCRFIERKLGVRNESVVAEENLAEILQQG